MDTIVPPLATCAFRNLPLLHAHRGPIERSVSVLVGARDEAVVRNDGHARLVGVGGANDGCRLRRVHRDVDDELGTRGQGRLGLILLIGLRGLRIVDHYLDAGIELLQVLDEELACRTAIGRGGEVREQECDLAGDGGLSEERPAT